MRGSVHLVAGQGNQAKTDIGTVTIIVEEGAIVEKIDNSAQTALGIVQTACPQ